MAFPQMPSTPWWRRLGAKPIRPRLLRHGGKRPRRVRPPGGPLRAGNARPVLTRADKEETMATKTSSSSSEGKSKVRKVMKEHKQGTLKSGSGKKVKSRKQAVAIALNEARKSGAKIPRKKKK